MADRTITATVECGLGGSFYALVFGEAHYKLWDMVPIAGDMAIRQLMTTLPPPVGWSSGDTLSLMTTVSPGRYPLVHYPSALPEGGQAVYLPGDSQYLSSVYNETSATPWTTPQTLEVVVVVHRLPSVGQEPAIMAGGPAFGVTMQSNGRVYGWYNGVRVVDLPIVIGATSHIVLIRSGASPDLITLYVNGVADTATPARANITRGHVHFGKHWTNAHFLEATYSFAAFYPRALSVTDVALHYAATVWTDVSADVMVEPALTVERGIRDHMAQARVSSTGTCTFALDNSTLNSGGLLGYYSPNHPNRRPSFASGIPVRVLVDDSTTEYEIFRGRVQEIRPIPGIDGVRNTLVVATDLIDDIARFRLNQLPILEDIRADDVFLTLISTLPNQPAGIVFGEGSEVYPLALDNTSDEEVTMLQEFLRLAMSEFGRIYVSRLGQLVFENRVYRTTKFVAKSLTDSQIAIDSLSVVDKTRDSLNSVQVTVHPRVIDDEPTTVLFSLQSPFEIPIGETRTLLGPYRVESAPDTIVRVGGLDMVQPVLGTDYLFNSASDGSGVDYSAYLTVIAFYGANGVSYRLTNGTAAIGYVTKLQARGRGVYDFRTVVIEAKNDVAIAQHGVSSLVIDMPYQEDAGIAQRVADGVLASYGPLATIPNQVSLYVNDADLGGILGYDVSTRLTITEEVTNLVAEQVFINGIRFELLDGVLGRLTWWLAPPEDGIE